MSKIKIGITQGDINGIGYEVIIKSLLDNRIMDFCTPIVYGSPKVAAYHRKALNINNFNFNIITNAENAHPKRPNIIDCNSEEVKVELGKSTEFAGEAAFLALEKAIEDLKEEKIDALITAPINKNNIKSEKFNFNGHTEYLQDKFRSEDILMLLISDNLRLGVVTTHIPIKEVPKALTKDKIIKKIELMHNTLKNDFNISKPKIAVFGLNPHSGDDGVIGTEEIETIIPAIEEVRSKNIMAIGPYPADGFFGSGKHTQFDGILAMYHDQGLAPFKALAFDSGVNYTAGLPIIRTSPAHGTAYEIAGENIASKASFMEALYMTIDTYKTRNSNKKLKANSLQKSDDTKEKPAKNGKPE